jgi:hypothetical protein
VTNAKTEVCRAMAGQESEKIQTQTHAHDRHCVVTSVTSHKSTIPLLKLRDAFGLASLQAARRTQQAAGAWQAANRHPLGGSRARLSCNVWGGLQRCPWSVGYPRVGQTLQMPTRHIAARRMPSSVPNRRFASLVGWKNLGTPVRLAIQRCERAVTPAAQPALFVSPDCLPPCETSWSTGMCFP